MKTETEIGGSQPATNKKNLLLLVYLRWIAVAGQVMTILVVHFLFGIFLPLPEMACVIAFLVGLNMVSLLRYAHRQDIRPAALFVELLLDVAALTTQLYLSGGAANPFISLFLLQVTLAAVLLDVWATWALVAVSSGCFLWLTRNFRDIGLRHHGDQSAFFDLHLHGMFICFLLAAVLLVLFIARINRNLAERDVHLALLRQRSAEEDHIVRMGLLASGAAHELGTPLSTLSVVLGDWQEISAARGDEELQQDVLHMQGQLERCKEIVSAILLSAGEARGEDARRTAIRMFLDDTMAEWEKRRDPPTFDYVNQLTVDRIIASDTVLSQAIGNVLDNALDASPGWVGVDVCEWDEEIVIRVTDRGPGFSDEMLGAFGRPYLSSKDRPGSGLGLFLVVNVLRKLGGRAHARNLQEGGACVELRLPLSALVVE